MEGHQAVLKVSKGCLAVPAFSGGQEDRGAQGCPFSLSFSFFPFFLLSSFLFSLKVGGAVHISNIRAER